MYLVSLLCLNRKCPGHEAGLGLGRARLRPDVSVRPSRVHHLSIFLDFFCEFLSSGLGHCGEEDSIKRTPDDGVRTRETTPQEPPIARRTTSGRAPRRVHRVQSSAWTWTSTSTSIPLLSLLFTAPFSFQSLLNLVDTSNLAGMSVHRTSLPHTCSAISNGLLDVRLRASF